ncbi:hypothetical protein Slin15195_G035140 [Septoria linicola]|uniref:Uncharacterized protein n=1 Tax=Septoria linicola TaxID=215465 RepID=A0A9Q9AJI4_9PEZI|nr:hypothetical protein Slin15195_G035140 [Septoria linicola]
MSDQRSGSGESGLQVSGPLSLGSISPSSRSPIAERKPDLERHISHIPQDSDEDEVDVDPNASGGLKTKLKKLKNRVAHGSQDKSESTTAPSDYTEKRHDSGNTNSDLEITPGLSLTSSGNIDSDEIKAKTPILERHISSIGPDGHLHDAPEMEKPRGRSPKLERHISGIPQEDYDSDRE